MHPSLEKLARDVSQAIEGASPRELAYAPAAGVWSCALVLEHLYRSYTGTTRGLERVLEGNASLATALPLKWRLIQWWVIRLGNFPQGRKSPLMVEPRGQGLEQMPQKYFAELTRMDDRLSECERRFGAHRKVLDHPVLKALTVEQWRKFHLVHGEHHAKQLRQRRALAQKAFAAPG